MNLKIKRLGELCKVIAGQSPEGQFYNNNREGLPFYQGKKDFTEKYIGAPATWTTSVTKIAQENDILMSIRAPVGPVNFSTQECCIGRGLAAIRSGEKIDCNYLYLYLSSMQERICGTKGSVFSSINKSEIENLPIPLPPLDDQIRIAAILTRAEKLIARRKASIKALDELLKSTFLEMFGDPVRNEKGWERVPLSKLGSLDRGVSKHRPRNAPQLLGGKYPLIQTGEVSNSGTYITEYSQTYSELGFKQSKMWKAGTLCITIAANIAKTGILTFDACFPDSVVGFTTYNNETNILYIHHLFGFFQMILEKNAPQAAQKNINLDILRNLQVPKPPLPLQNQFAAIVEKVESLKAKSTESLAELENLYGSLSQRAFKGELDLSRAEQELKRSHAAIKHVAGSCRR